MRSLYTAMFFIATSVLASSGDRAADFGRCVDLCKVEDCGQYSTYKMPISLRLTRWTCTDDCKYRCMHQITERDVQAGKRVQQYYGKWPFWRFAGLQEPASVVFSLLNLWAHWRGASKIRRRVSSYHPMKSYYRIWSFVSMNAWVWSAVFHSRGGPAIKFWDLF